MLRFPPACYFVTLALALSVASANKRLRITNGCTKEPLWVAHMAGADEGPDAQSLKLKPGEHHDFDTSDGLSSTRFWPKMRCNHEGSHCLIGESGGPGQECDETMGCAPPIDSKFEGTFGTNDGIDWIDVSLVDGWTLPFTFNMVLQDGKKCNAGDGDRQVVTSVDCSNLTLDNCPAHEVLGDQNTNLQVIHPGKKEVVGCYSPCAKLTSNNWGNSIADGVSTADDAAVPYCCPTPPMNPEDCRAGPVEDTNFVRAVHKHCPGVYGYSYDDGMGLITCPKDTKYEMIYFCPEGEAKANSHGKKPTPHGGHKDGSHGHHGGNRSNTTARVSSTTTTKATSSTSSAAGAKHHHSSATTTTRSSASSSTSTTAAPRRNKSASTDAASTTTESAPGLASACPTTTGAPGDGNVSVFTPEQAMYMPDHEYCDNAALWRGQSTGRADCQRRCSAMEECMYYSHWLSGKINWCRLTASCAFRGTEALQRVSMFRRCDADEPNSTDKPREVIPGEVVHILLKSEDLGGSIAPGGERHSGAPNAVPVEPATALALLLGSSAAVAAAASAVVRWQRGAGADWRRLQEDSPEDRLLVESQPIDAVA